MKNIILIGYRATGKTTVAETLGLGLGVPFYDSDVEIRRTVGKTIAEIFASEGEEKFRDLEAATIADILRRHAEEKTPFILATGGGAVLREETRQRLRDAGHVVWLTARPETVLRRMRGDSNSAATRPALTDLAPLEEIVALLERRTPFYSEAAHTTIETDSLGIDEIVRQILSTCRIPAF